MTPEEDIRQVLLATFFAVEVGEEYDGKQIAEKMVGEIEDDDGVRSSAVFLRLVDLSP